MPFRCLAIKCSRVIPQYVLVLLLNSLDGWRDVLYEMLVVRRFAGIAFAASRRASYQKEISCSQRSCLEKGCYKFLKIRN